MSEDGSYQYEAKVWQVGLEWTAKVLRNGVYFDSRGGFDSYANALIWAREQAENDRRSVEAERWAERVTL